FKQPSPPLSDAERDVADAVRLALSGDAGQRALLAWHLGWEAPRQVSSESWIAPVLAELLDDPYAAVRCIAERSLKALSKNLVPKDYDFALEPDQRPSSR